MKNIIYSLAALWWVIPHIVMAESHSVFVDTIIQSPTAPVSVIAFIRKSSGELSFISGESVPVSGQSNSWVVGSSVQASDFGKEASISFVSFTFPNTVAYVPWQNLSLASPSLFSGDVNILREHVLEMKDKVEEAYEKVNQSLLGIEGAKRSIDGVEGGAMLRKYEFEAETLSVKKAGVASDCASLEHAVARMKLQPAPINAAKREVELQQQVALFAGLAKSAEVGEVDRREQGDIDQEQARALIESTQYDNEEELAHRLELLRERRALLEDR